MVVKKTVEVEAADGNKTLSYSVAVYHLKLPLQSLDEIMGHFGLLVVPHIPVVNVAMSHVFENIWEESTSSSSSSSSFFKLLHKNKVEHTHKCRE